MYMYACVFNMITIMVFFCNIYIMYYFVIFIYAFIIIIIVLTASQPLMLTEAVNNKICAYKLSTTPDV